MKSTAQQEFDFDRPTDEPKPAPAEIVEKIKKLLRLAADKSNRHEAAHGPAVLALP